MYVFLCTNQIASTSKCCLEKFPEQKENGGSGWSWDGRGRWERDGRNERPVRSAGQGGKNRRRTKAENCRAASLLQETR